MFELLFPSTRHCLGRLWTLWDCGLPLVMGHWVLDSNFLGTERFPPGKREMAQETPDGNRLCISYKQKFAKFTNPLSQVIENSVSGLSSFL